MHVAIFIPALHGGGAEFVARRWIGEMDALGHRVTVYTYDRDQPTVDLPAAVRVRRFKPPLQAMRYFLLPMWLQRRISEDQPDVLLSLLTYSNVVALLTRRLLGDKDLPIVISERNMPSLQAQSASRQVRLIYRIARHLYSHATGVIAISHPVAGDLASAFHVKPERLYVVPNPVIGSEEGTPTADVVKSAPSSVHILFVGRLVEQKRPSLFLAVLNALERQGVQARGTMIGDGGLRESLERESSALGLRVTFTGWQEPWWTAVQDVDCLLVTAKFEGLANVLVEAAAADIPSAASSRAVGVADAIVPGITGELAMTDSPDDLASAVLQVSARPRPSALGVQGWLTHFSTTGSTARLVAALEESCRPSGTESH
jgi:glycosyltransferase involved in cell wall biosynthesis